MSANALPSISHEVSASPSSRLDKLGIAASAACAVHCLAAPFLLLLLPAAGSIWSHPSVHWILAALVLPLAVLVVYRGYRVHRRRAAMVCALVGVAFVVAGLVVPDAVANATPASVEQLAGADAGGPEPAAAAACSESCCPTFSQDPATGEYTMHDPKTGEFTLNVPRASVATMIGSAFLILAHAINLHGCHCFKKSRRAEEGDCGCPTTCG